MVAIIHQMADGEDWLPGVDLQAMHKELRDVKDWLAAIQQKKQAPSLPHTKHPGPKSQQMSRSRPGVRWMPAMKETR